MESPETPSEAHPNHRDLWRAMRDAYQDYRRATVHLNLVASRVSEIPPAEQKIGMELATRRQRTAFENYVERRMRFSEYVFDRSLAAARNGVPRPMRKRVLLSLAGTVGLLSAISVDLVRERAQARLLESKRAAAKAPVERVAIVAPAEQPPAPQKAAVPVEPGSAPQPSIRNPKAPAKRPKANKRQAGKKGPDLYRFMVATDAPQFTPVGPARLYLSLADPGRRYVNLCVVAENLAICRNHITKDRAIRIPLSDPSRELELVVHRIEASKAFGSLSVRSRDLSSAPAPAGRPNSW